jgi:uncharacterized membrane protein
MEMHERLALLERRVAALEQERAPSEFAELSLPAERWEATVGLTWLNRLGAGLVVAGLVFGVVWANQRGYLTTTLRNLLLAVGSAVVFTVGVRGLRSEDRRRRRFGSGVTVIGAFGLYLTLFTASLIDDVVSASVTAELAVGLTLGMAVAAHRWRQDLLAVLGALGGLSVPLLLAEGDPGFAALCSYLTVLTAGFLWLQRRHGWSILGFVLALGVSAYYVAVTAQSPGSLAHAAAATAGLGLIAGAYLERLWRRSALSVAEHAALAVALGAAAAILHQLGSDAARPTAAALTMIVVGMLAVGAGGGMRAADRDAGGSTLVAALGVVLLALAHRLTAWYVVPPVAAVVAFYPGWVAADPSLRLARGAHVAMHAVAFAVAVALVEAIAGAGAAPIWFSLAAVVYALALAGTGFACRHRLSRLLGMALLATTLLKMFAVDVWALGAGVRVAAFLILGLGLLGASFLYSRYADR